MIVEEHDGALLDNNNPTTKTLPIYTDSIEITNKIDVTHPLRPPLDRISVVGNGLFIPHDLVYIRTFWASSVFGIIRPSPFIRRLADFLGGMVDWFHARANISRQGIQTADRGRPSSDTAV
jgi:hypothetical protein